MQNRFGIKDFLFLVVLLVTLGSVWLSMVQKTRMELAQQSMSAKLADIEQQVAQVNRKLESGAAVARGPSAGAAAGNGVSTDESWARPGVKVEHWAAPHCAIDPSTIPGFAVGGEFTELFDPARGTPMLVVTFIALLELVREALVEITQSECYAPIYVKLAHAQSH